ncbi:MAG: carbohydrate kinase [Clostridiales bacterium]|nr:carbohydrate kinase [Clostridiales bacterium]
MAGYDVVALGELLIDFTENGRSPQGNPLLEANPGGAPCNVLAMLSGLGKRTAFIGKIGKDAFGRQLREAVQSCGINVSGLAEDEAVPTTLAFVHTQPDGDREFSFYRDPGADRMLRREEIPEELIKRAKIFHFGTLSSTHEPAREATRYALEIARKSGCVLSFDPNLREPLWDSPEDARREIGYGLGVCDILKISDNEVEFLTGTTDYEKGVAQLREKYRLPLVFVTLGKAGSMAFYGDLTVKEDPFLQECTVETTGAGDTFAACALNYLLEHGIGRPGEVILTETNLRELLTFANAGSSLITTRKGALKVMPTRAEIEALIRRGRVCPVSENGGFLKNVCTNRNI